MNVIGSADQTQSTTFTCLNVLSNGNAIVMGYSVDPNLLNLYKATNRPFFIIYDPKMNILFAKYIYNTQTPTSFN